MPLDKYPFSESYGWKQDEFRLTWQLLLSNPEAEEKPFIVSSLMFLGDVCGKTEKIIEFYLKIFKDSKRGLTLCYTRGMEPDKERSIMFADFMNNGSWFVAMESARRHNFSFNGAISLLIPCETQEKLDYYWEKLSALCEAEQCGWLKNKFGVSWELWPIIMENMFKTGT